MTKNLSNDFEIKSICQGAAKKNLRLTDVPKKAKSWQKMPKFG